MIPRYGSPPIEGQRYQRRPGVYAILPRGGDILLTHQSEPVPEYQLPGGGIDPGENTLPALMREVMEETGWSIARPRYFGAFRRFTYMPEYDIWAEKVCRLYVARPIVKRTAELDSGHQAVWASLDNAADLLGNPGDRTLLAEFNRTRV